MSAAPILPALRIQPSRGWASLRLGELWFQYRELLYFLLWRDVKIRYKQTLLGGAWAVFQPLSTTFVFSIFFGRLAKLPSDGVPYPVFSLAAIVPWTFFANGLAQCANSLVSNANLIKKVYFPRLVIPVAAVLSGAVDFAVAFALLIAMMLIYGIPLDPRMLWVPLFLLWALVASLGIGLWLSALNVQFRDVRFIVPFLLQIWMYASPIVYPSTLLPEPWRTVYGLNPMVGVIEGFRWALLGTSAPPTGAIAVSSAVSLVVLIGGAFYFQRMERRFADII